MTSHGFIEGKRRSNERGIAKAVYEAGEKVGAKEIAIHFFNESEIPVNIIVEFDCHNLDGEPNLIRVQKLAAELNKIPKVTWYPPLIIDSVGYSQF